jgi:DNA-directed RNA polymerase subunit RPC12/RpoP
MDAAWLDGNAVAGLLAEALGEDMTTVERRCEHCGSVYAIGAYRAYLGAGVVLRCPGCGSPGLRVVELTDGFSVSWARPGAGPAP